MSIFRASFRDEAKAFLVDLFHVVPPQVLLSLVGDDIMDARLSQVFIDDILSINSMEIIFDVVWSAVFSIGEAFILSELEIASLAAPSDIARFDVDIIT